MGAKAVTIASSLRGGCGLSHERVRALVWSLGWWN